MNRMFRLGLTLLSATMALGFISFAPSRAELQVAETSFEAGEVKSGTALSHRFTFTNRGNTALEITDARASCGCVTPLLERRVLQPGESGALTLEVNTLSQPAGRLAWTVRLITKEGEKVDETSLRITAQLITEVSVQPSAVTLFTESATSQEIVLTDLRKRPLSITQVQASSPHLKARVTGQSVNALGHLSRKILIEVSADLPDGRHTELLDIYTDDPDYRDLKVPITIVKRPRTRLSVTPSTVAWIAPARQPIPSQLLRIRDKNGDAVEIERVIADEPALTCVWSQGPNETATAKITVDRKHLTSGTLRTAVHVTVVKPVRETLTIPVTVSGE